MAGVWWAIGVGDTREKNAAHRAQRSIFNLIKKNTVQSNEVLAKLYYNFILVVCLFFFF